MNNKTLLLIIGIVLLAIGLIKPDLSNILSPASPTVVTIDELKLSKPTEELMSASNDVVKALSVNPDRKVDGKKLASLYNDLATLISLDGDEEVIKNTDEIRQSNRLAGLMLRLDIKGKYEDLPEAAEKLIITAIGDDHILLSKELRAKAVEGFRALAWACNEGSK